MIKLGSNVLKTNLCHLSTPLEMHFSNLGVLNYCYIAIEYTYKFARGIIVEVSAVD